jgi:DNA mismatch repair protein MutL
VPRIQVLPESLQNQIAAGEVVERPASVVKELIENALDAGARSIQVEMENGGLTLVRVADDGGGMEPADAVLALARHATSKLQDAAGLTAIATMGFRGEAVPAIASVSRLRLDTATAGAPAGTRLVVEGGTLVEQGEIARAPGTTFEVRDLFFNTPARRKFMKSQATESGHAGEAVVRVALARPDVAFTVRMNGRLSWSSPAGADPRERAAIALGKEAFPHLLPVDGGKGDVRVRGLAGSPDFSQATQRALYLFVNGRYVRDRGIAHAVLRAYSDTLPPGRHPAGVLFIELPLSRVDVNVHPQKLEVRFADAREVYDGVVFALADALRTAPWLRHQAPAAPVPAGAGEPALPVVSEPSAGETAAVLDFARARNLNRAFDFHVTAASPPPLAPLPEAPAAPLGYFASLRYIGQHARTYLLCEAPGSTLVIVDQHASHERLLFHRLREAFRARSIPIQPFLLPQMVNLPVAQARALEAHLTEVRSLGLDLEPFGGETFAVKGAPAALAGADLQGMLLDLAQQLEQTGRGRAVDDALHDLLATMACHSAVRAHEDISAEEVRALLDGLDGIDFKARCPHGRPVVFELPLAELERRVGRR